MARKMKTIAVTDTELEKQVADALLETIDNFANECVDAPLQEQEENTKIEVDFGDLTKQIEEYSQSTKDNTSVQENGFSLGAKKEVFEFSKNVYSDDFRFETNPSMGEQGSAMNDPKTLPPYYNLSPANDDITGHHIPIIKTEQKLSSYHTTTALSTVWALGGATIMSLCVPSGTSFTSFLASGLGIATLAGTIVPILSFFGFSQLLKRTKALESAMQNVVASNIALSKNKSPKEIQALEIGDNVRKELSAMGHGIERTLERAAELEAIVHGEVQNLERAYGENENRIHKLVLELSSERIAILKHADRVRNSLQDTRASLSQELGSLSDEISANVTQIAEVLTKTLEEKSIAIFENLEKASKDIADKIAVQLEVSAENNVETNKKLLSALNNELNEAQENFKQHSLEFFRDFYTRLDETQEKAEQIGSGFYKTANEVADNFDKIFEKIDASIDQNGDKSLSALNEKMAKFDKASDDVIYSLEEKFNKFDTSLEQHSQKTLDLFSVKAAEIAKNSANISQNIDIIAEESIHALEKRMETINQLIADQNKAVVSSLEMNTEAFEEKTMRFVDLLDGRISTIDQNLKEHQAALSSGYEDILQSANKVTENIQGQIGRVQNSIEGAFTAGQGHLSRTIEDKTQDLEQTLHKKLNVLSDYITNIEQAIVSNVGKLDEKLGNLDAYTSSLGNSLSNGFDVIKSALEEQSENITNRAESLRNSLTVDNYEINKVLFEQANLLEERIERVQALLSHGGDDFSETIKEQFHNYEKMLSENGMKLTSSFGEHLNTLHNYAEKIKNAIDYSSEMKTALDTRTEELNSSLSTQISLLDEHTHALQKTIGKNLDTARTDLEQTALVLASSLKERIAEAAKFFSIEAQKAEFIVDQINGKLTDSVEDFEKDFLIAQKNIISGTEVIAGNIKDKISEINEQIYVQADYTGQKIVEAGQQVASAIYKTGENLNLNLEHSICDLEEKLKSRIDAVDAKMDEVTINHTQRIKEKIDELGNVSHDIYKAIIQTHSSLTQTSEQFTKSAQQVQDDLVLENKKLIDALSKNSSATVDTVRTISQNLNNNIDNLLKHLNSSSGSLAFLANNGYVKKDKALNSDTKKEVFNSLSNKSSSVSLEEDNKIDLLKKHFDAHAEILDDAARLFEESEQQSLPDFNALASLSKGIDQKSKEVEKAIAHYKDVVKQRLEDSSNPKISSVLNDASSRFEDATGVIHEATQDMQSVLGKAEKLKNPFASDYSETAKKNSIAMKKAIQEQVQALKELTNIQKSERAAKDLNLEHNNKLEEKDYFYAKPYEAPNLARRAMNKNDNKGASSNSWVSDLLARASKAEEINFSAPPSEPRPGEVFHDTKTKVETLASLSKEIVQAINHNAIVDLWTNYKRGKKNINPALLYTDKGLIVFDKVKRKYIMDATFRNSANQYIADFERALRSVSDDTKRRGKFMRDYLISDTGKVYTMLAHASKRIV